MDYDIGPDESVSVAVLRAVCLAENRSLGSLPPLTDVVDPDALDNLFDSTANNINEQNCCLSFQFGNSDLFIDQAESIEVEPKRESIQVET